MYQIKAIIEKEWLELKVQKSLWWGMLGIPILLLAIAIIVVYIAGIATARSKVPISALLNPFLFGLRGKHLAQALVGQQFSIILIIIPVMIPSFLASYSIVGEKAKRTLEPLLLTPISTYQLLMAKMLSVWMPSIIISWSIGGLFILSLYFITLTQRVFDAIVNVSWLVGFTISTPFVSVIATMLMVIISARTSDPRTAQQYSSISLIPLAGISYGQATGLLVLTLEKTIILCVALFILSILSIITALKLFDRDKIFTKWNT